ncbi:MAG: dihydroxyacetone kinase subunit L [Rhodospirillales bacterium]|jgi:phosphoenolpyruvate---glycerone phosphotransferase subunit DhaL|nr:dihydroxyacetone kinase subunit L [Rhodospirillales bacterium]
MSLSVNDLAGGVSRAHLAMAHLEQVLNEADAKLGDGDTGSMLARVLEHLAAVNLDEENDVGAAFNAFALAAAAATGSSLGTLLSTAMMAAGKEARGQNELDWSAMSGLFAVARDTMMARGRASVGDKTVLDGLDALATATNGLNNPKAIAEASITATRDALARFRGQPCRVGRARMFAEKSVQLDDPGMLALALLTEAVAGKTSAAG